MPNFLLVRSNSLMSVTIMRAPVIPSGWPRARAPPLGLSFSSDSVLGSDIVRSNSHWDQAISSNFVIVDFFRKHVNIDGSLHVSSAHALDSTTNSDLDLVGSDSVGDSA